MGNWLGIKLKTKEEKIQFIINHLEKMKGLEFIDSDEISACNLAIRRLRSGILDSKNPNL